MEFNFFYLQVWESQLGIRIGEGIREKTWHKAIIATEKWVVVRWSKFSTQQAGVIVFSPENNIQKLIDPYRITLQITNQ